MNRILQIQKNKSLGIVLLFAAFMFVQFVILRLGNQAGRGFLSNGRQELVYLFIQVVVILGFLAHALIRSRLRSGHIRKILTVSIIGMCLAGTAIMLFCPPDSLFYLIITGVTVLLLGYAGGAVYLQLSSYTASRKHAGLCIGTGYALAVALQYCLQLQWTVRPALMVLLTLAFAALTMLLLSENEESEKSSEKKSRCVRRSRLIFTAVITVVMLIFISYYNSYIHHLQIASGYTDYNVYSWPRLLMIPGIILFGVLGDIKGGKFLPLSSLCTVVIALLNAALIGRETYLLNMCLYYVALTAVIAYYHLTFLRLASSAKRPALWAPMGRMLDSAVVILTLSLQFNTFSQVTVLIIDIAALAVAMIMMALNGDFHLTVSAGQSENTEPAPKADPFPAIQEQYGLTPSEMKVLRELVLTDDKQDIIAARLEISVSTLRHHITAIYKKTGAQTRSALCKLNANL